MSLCQLCEQWVEQLNHFLLTLEDEFVVLKSSDADAIAITTERKKALLTQLSHTESALLQLRNSKEQTQIVDWLVSSCPDSASVKQLVGLSERIKSANQRNAMLLQSLMRLNEFGLNLLSGKISTQDTYGASGQLKSATPISSLTLATA